MKQQPKSSRRLQHALPAALMSPPCELCAELTRFVGLESIPDCDTADLCTYECSACGHVQAKTVSRDGGVADGTMRH
jgi:hypothetical protein